ncbi:MAG: hypothetical protein MUE67_06435 [Anaerolineales bacterium]|jgi:hypothetical protein|nr:hypothetical protein [Anaerolineales bacterium]
MGDGARQIRRLDEIAASLQQRPDALALIGLGSVGRELQRLDAFSDLDFFVLVEPGSKAAYLDSLDWLSGIHPIAYAFKNTVDGYKLLFADRIFCEFAVFETHELAGIPFAPGRVVWKRETVAESISQPGNFPAPGHSRGLEWLLGEALTNLYIGLCRYQRGEWLSAQRFIQGYAVDRVIELSEYLGDPVRVERDSFSPERRFEQRYPQFAGRLAGFIQGYLRSPQSAREILGFLVEHFPVNQAMAQAILDLCANSEI